MIRVTAFNDRRVAVFGLGASGIASARALAEGGARVAVWDDSAPSRDAAAKAGLELVDLSTADWSGFAALVLAPGVPLTHPEPHWTVERARAAGVEIIGDVELFCRERALTCPEAPFIAVTGTNGKSTTTALITHILRELGHGAEMGGNIGRAILTLEPPARGRFHVIEMSSFQIDLTPSLKPTVGVLLNVTPDHLDRHGTIETYAAIKERLVEDAEIACVGIDDEFCRAVAARRRGTGLPTVTFAVTEAPHADYALRGDDLVASSRGTPLVLAHCQGLRSLRGVHNAQNALASIAAVRAALAKSGFSPDADWQAVLGSYPGLPHRMEEIGRLGRVLLINDSKATNADSAEKALASWDRDIFWILGGRAKAGGITSLESYFPRIAKAYLIGEAMEEFAATLSGKVSFERCGALETALAAALRDAAASKGAEPVVLLSPACASFDQYRNFEVRGDHFRALAAALPGIALRSAA